jgi:cytochrome c-type biogenesis protein CcmE
MAEITWEKNPETARAARSYLAGRSKFVIIGGILLVAVAFLVVKATMGGRYYTTVDELLSDSTKVGKDVRVAGAVDGESIHFDPETQQLSFTIVHISNDAGEIREAGGLAEVLYQALQDPDSTRLQVVQENAEVPENLKNEAQAIVEGYLDEDGIFRANNLMLKCPTRYSDEVPAQVAEQ